MPISADTMDNKMMIIIGVVVVAVVAVAGGYFIFYGNGNPSASSGPADPTVINGLWVMGNADHDFDIDNDDVAYIEGKIANGNLSDADKFWCDANKDGAIDQKDVDFVKTLIDGKATTINYLNYNGVDSKGKLLGGATTFNVPDADKPLYLMLEARCLAEEVLVTINKNLDHYIIVAASKQCKDYDGQLQFFSDTAKYPAAGQNVMMTTNCNISAEEVATLERKFVENSDSTYSSIAKGNLVLCMGADNYYNKGIEEKISGYGSTQVVRLPSWENGYTVSGLMTFGYLFGSQGEITGTTSWEAANEYLTWNQKYNKIITDEVSKIADKKSMLNLSITESGGAYTIKAQSTGTDPYNYSVLAGADNYGTKFSGTQANGSITVTKENIATYASDVDVIILQTPGEAFSATAGPTNSTNCLSTGISQLDGYVKTTADIYSMTFCILNGAPYIISMVYYAKYLYSDNPVLGALDPEAIYDEYLDLVGWGSRDLGYLVLTSGPGHTTTPLYS